MKIIIQENKDNINTKFHYIGRMVSAAENVHAQPWMEKDLYKVYDVLDTYQPDMLIIGFENLNPDIINVNGGAIALGHPLGCTGAKLSVQLFDEMRKRNMAGKYGAVTMCVGTGQGACGIFEFLN